MKILLSTWSIYEKEESACLFSGQWCEGNGFAISDLEKPALPMNLRRRLTPLGKLVMAQLYTVCSKLEDQQIPWIVSSRHGDSTRMVNLLGALEQKAPLSPMDFSLSVHNAIIGLFSIESKNKELHTVISGSAASFECGLLEAYALQKSTGKPVGYLFYDFPLPSFFEQNEGDNQGYCFALVLKNDESEEKESPIIQVHFNPYVTDNDPIVIPNAQLLGNYLMNDNTKIMRIPLSSGEFHFEKK